MTHFPVALVNLKDITRDIITTVKQNGIGIILLNIVESYYVLHLA